MRRLFPYVLILALLIPSTVFAASPRYTLPKLRAGMTKAHVRHVMTDHRPFRIQYRYVNGTPKNRLVSVKPTPYWAKRYHGKFPRDAKFTVTLTNGKRVRKWKTGTATWYSIADNTPAGSRQTASGHPLGSFDGWTFASCNFPMGTQLLIKGPNGKTHKVTMTDTGGYETIDLYKPASDYFGMDGMSKFKYIVLRRGW